MLVPAKHGIDSLREFSVVGLVNATDINPKVFQAIFAGFFSTEPDLLIASLMLASAVYHVFKDDLVRIRALCMR
jgi:hypothetical protein